MQYLKTQGKLVYDPHRADLKKTFQLNLHFNLTITHQ